MEEELRILAPPAFELSEPVSPQLRFSPATISAASLSQICSMFHVARATCVPFFPHYSPPCLTAKRSFDHLAVAVNSCRNGGAVQAAMNGTVSTPANHRMTTPNALDYRPLPTTPPGRPRPLV